MNKYCNISELLGKTLKEIIRSKNTMITFIVSDGSEYRLCHEQDCCEQVEIEDICGDLSDLIGSPLTMAEESTSKTAPAEDNQNRDYDESTTWTFYRLATVKGYVTIRWYGTSNGYYSEDVDFVRIK